MNILAVLFNSTNVVHAHLPMSGDNDSIIRLYEGKFCKTSLCGGAYYNLSECLSRGIRPCPPNEIGKTWDLVTCEYCLLLRYELLDPEVSV